jgi:hypothetical protein
VYLGKLITGIREKFPEVTRDKLVEPIWKGFPWDEMMYKNVSQLDKRGAIRSAWFCSDDPRPVKKPVKISQPKKTTYQQALQRASRS